MRRRHLLVGARAPVVAVFVVMMGAMILRGGPVPEADPSPQASAPAAASPQAPAAAAQASPVQAPAVRVAADLTTPAADAAQTLSVACGLGGGQSTPWSAWVDDGAPRWPVSSGDASVLAAAAAARCGYVIVIANVSDAGRTVRLEARAGRGVYSIDRLSFAVSPAANSDMLERQPSALLGAAGSISRTFALAPHTGVALRLLNRSQGLATAFASVRTQLRQVRASDAGSAARLSVPLTECGSEIACLSGGIQGADRKTALRHIHRALLTVGHAQALAKNAHAGGKLATDGGQAFQVALNGLETALAELSAACLNLVPTISQAPANASSPMERTVSVALENRGAMAVTGVRIGVEAPAACRVSPSDHAIFGAVGPGQSVRATFTVVLAEGVDPGTLQGEVSYFAERAPATLRVVLR